MLMWILEEKCLTISTVSIGLKHVVEADACENNNDASGSKKVSPASRDKLCCLG